MGYIVGGRGTGDYILSCLSTDSLFPPPFSPKILKICSLFPSMLLRAPFRWVCIGLLWTTAGAQTSTSSSTSTSAGTSSSRSLSSQALQATVIPTSTTFSTSSTTLPPAPTVNTTSASDGTVQLFGPATFVECELALFSFISPPFAKTVAVFVTNTSVFLEPISLSGLYPSYTTGTFQWFVDMPAGLSIQVQLYVMINGSPVRSTTNPLVVQPGTTSSCLAQNSGPEGETQSIISYASSLDPGFVYTTGSPASHRRSSTGAIAGGVVGGSALISVAVLSAWLLRRRRRAVHPGSQAQCTDVGTKKRPPSTPGYSYGASPQFSQVFPGYGGIPAAEGVTRTTDLIQQGAFPVSPGSPILSSKSGKSGKGTEGLDDPTSFLGRGDP